VSREPAALERCPGCGSMTLRVEPPTPTGMVYAHCVACGHEAERDRDADALDVEDFHCHMPSHRYIYTPSRELWPASSVNARLPAMPTADGKSLAPSAWIAENRPVEQMTWAPGEPTIIRDRLIAEGGWIEHQGVKVFNLYRWPRIGPGDPVSATPWLDHVARIYPEEAEHIVRWLAHRVQRPGEKSNHALVLGGTQGIGKDTLLEPARRAVGPWNVAEVSPTVLLGRFNGYLQSVILRVSEARDLGDVNRFALYDHMKSITAAPPDVLRIDRKNLHEYYVPNVCGVVVTTNHRIDSLHLPSDNRRHFVAWSEATKEDFSESYWSGLWSWYETGGYEHVAAYLGHLDLSEFRPTAPPPKTEAWHAVVAAGQAPEQGELADVLEEMGWPPAVTIPQVIDRASLDFAGWLRDRKNCRAVPHRFEEVGYLAIRNADAKDGKWRVAGSRRVVYARHDLARRDQIQAARNLTGEASTVPDATGATGSDSGPKRGPVTDVTGVTGSPTHDSSASKHQRPFSERPTRARERDRKPVTPVTPATPAAEPGEDEPESTLDMVREVFAGFIEREEETEVDLPARDEEVLPAAALAEQEAQEWIPF